MKKYFLIAMAAIAALSSCSSDNDPIIDETGKQALTFTATMEGIETRAIFDEEKMRASWEMNDQININGKTYIAQSAGTSTTFKAAVAGQEAQPLSSRYYAFFGCSVDGSTTALPAIINETWSEGKFNMPMYASTNSADNPLAFKNLCGVLAVKVTSAVIDKVKSIRVSSDNYAMSGEFNVMIDTYLKLKNETSPDNLTINYTSAVTTDAAGKTFYIAVPPQEIYHLLKIELSDDGTNFTKCMTTNKDAYIKIERSKIYSINFADNTEHPFVEFFYNGHTVRFATMNIGATSVASATPTYKLPNIGDKEVSGNSTIPECYGTYFKWGETTYPTSGCSYTTHSGDPFSHTILDAEHDAATASWGSPWRTPTKDDFAILYGACGGEGETCEISVSANPTKYTQGIYWISVEETSTPLKIDNDRYEVNGLLFVQDEAHHVFFPAAGYISHWQYEGRKSFGQYRASTKFIGETPYSYSPVHSDSFSFNLWMTDMKVYVNSHHYCDWARGLPVRPVCD